MISGALRRDTPGTTLPPTPFRGIVIRHFSSRDLFPAFLSGFGNNGQSMRAFKTGRDYPISQKRYTSSRYVFEPHVDHILQTVRPPAG